MCEAAAMFTSPVPTFSLPATDATVLLFSIEIATEPAIPTAPPPAPLLADAPLAEIPSSVTRASIVAPCALTVASAGSVATLVMRS